MPSLSHLQNDYEKAEYLQDILVSRATGIESDAQEYTYLRKYFLDNTSVSEKLPDFVRTKRDLGQFWQFIKKKFDTYAERREYIWESFEDLLNVLEVPGINGIFTDDTFEERLKKYGANSIHKEIQKALERKVSDPEGAITTARTILESTCKFILDERSMPYTDNTDLSVLYKNVAHELKLSPDQHSEDLFKQILGGCSAVVNGLGTMRNKFGDAHGKGIKKIKPKPRHAELAVYLSGSMSIFLIETHQENTPRM